MGMKRCKDCGSEISKSAKICPKCGKKQRNPLLIVLGVIIMFIGIGLLAGDVSKDNSNTSTSSSSTITSSSVVNKENYNKIEKGMTETQVKDILGEPQSTSESETPGVGTMILKHYQETFSLKAIDIYFLDGKVYMKNWTEL